MRRSTLAFGAFLWLVGCGPSGGGGGGTSSTTFTTGVDGNASLTALTPAQQTQLCNDLDSYVTRILTPPGVCKAASVEAAQLAYAFEPTQSLATLQSDCSQTYAACTSEDAGAADAGGAVVGTSCGFSSLSGTACTATVSQLSACLDGFGAAVADVPSCNTLTIADLDTDAGVLSQTPAACSALTATCPDAVTMVTAAPSVTTTIRR